MSSVLSDHLVIVLVGARNPLNIGAVARAMSNFGLRDLRIVNDYTVSLEDARSAINADEVVKNAATYANVGEAVADCSLVYGTTAVGDRKPEHPVDVLKQASQQVRSHAGKVAVLFGSEKHGLTNDSIAHCHRLLTIPMHTHGTSMNLGQAAAVVMYEMARDRLTMPPVSTDAAPATGEQIAVLDTVLLEALEACEYHDRFPAKGTPQQVREYTRRLQMPAQDVPVWIGFLRQFLWKMRGGKR